MQPAMRNLVELQLDWEPAKLIDAVATATVAACAARNRRKCACARFSASAPAKRRRPGQKRICCAACCTGTVELHQLNQRRIQEHRRSVRALPRLPPGMSGRRRYSPPDARKQGAYVAANGLTLADWAMTQLDLLGALGGMVAPAANWALSNRQMRWLLEKMLGIAQGRKLPRVASRNFMRRAHAAV